MSTIEATEKSKVDIQTLYDEAQALYRAKEWLKAARRFDDFADVLAKTEISKKKKRALPFAFARKSARLRADLAKIKIRTACLVYIRKNAKLTAHGKFYPQDAAGLREAITTIARDPELAARCDMKKMKSALRGLSKALASTDSALVSVNPGDRIDRRIALDLRDAIAPLMGAREMLALAPEHFLVLSYLFIIARDLDSAYWARKQAVLAAADDGFLPDTPDALVCKARAFAELGDRQRFDALMREIPPSLESLTERLRYTGMYTDGVRGGAEPRSDGSSEFARYLHGKKVAIVGPVDTGLQNGEEIDSFDVVIRMNYRGLSAFAPSVFGTRTDVSYYVRGMFTRDGSSIREAWADLKFAVHAASLASEFDGAPVKTWHSHTVSSRDTPFFAGIPNAFQRCILDLMHYDCHSIKLFNGNLWLDRTPTNPAYHKGSFADFNLPFVFVNHDIVSNFLFLKRVLQSGMIQTDEVLSSILAMSVDEYVSEMHRVHGAPAAVDSGAL